MKRLSFLIATPLLVLVLQAHSCKEPVDPPGAANCDDVACTMMFAMVTAEVKDANGQPVLLDEYYTIRDKNAQKITPESQVPQDGTYVILDDSWTRQLRNTSESFHFIGKKNGIEIVNEPYTIGADCCHVDKKSGKGTIVIP